MGKVTSTVGTILCFGQQQQQQQQLRFLKQFPVWGRYDRIHNAWELLTSVIPSQHVMFDRHPIDADVTHTHNVNLLHLLYATS